MFLKTVFWTLAGYLSGSLLFSAWLVRLFLKKNIRNTGDGNPGAMNAWFAGGARLGIPSVVLDFLKGALPVGLACHVFGVTGWWLVPVALAPAVGHGFSVFDRFRGGKAAAVTFGIWTGLTLWQGPTALGLLVALSLIFMRINLWTVIIPTLAFACFVIPKALGADEPYLIAVWLGNLIVFLIKFLSQLKTPVLFRDWLKPRSARQS